MILDYNNFYRQFGLRKVAQLLQPRFGLLQKFQLPVGSILHAAHGDPTKLGPVENDLAFRGIINTIQSAAGAAPRALTRPIQVEHVTALVDPIGSPLKASVSPMNLVRQYHLQHRRFRRVSTTETALQDKNSLIVFNYDMLPHVFRYPRTLFNQYFEWANVERTMWTKIAEVTALTERPQFVMRSLPKVLPSRNAFMQAAAAAKPSQRILSLFNTPEHLFLIELWKWFGPDRETSMLSAIPRDKLSRINLIFQESGKWLAINLGLLNSWRKPLPEEMVEGEKERNNLIKPDRMQLHALRFFMAIQHVRAEVNEEVTALAEQSLDADDEAAVVKELSAMKVTKVEDRTPSRDPVTGVISGTTSQLDVDDVAPAIDELEDTPDTVQVNSKLEEQIDEDIAAMERITAAKLQDATEQDAADADVGKTPRYDNRFAPALPPEEPAATPKPVLRRLALDEAVMVVCNVKADEGLMSAAQYRHFDTLSKSYKTLVAPDGSSTLEEYINIPSEMLKIKESPTIPDIPTVTDKTMLKSSLLEFDERYIKEVMPRDVTAMALSIQNAGVAVVGYRVERVENIMGSYEMHTLRTVPVDGAATTLHFKLPVMEEDGSYMANGVKYRLRKQRGDLPIRKVAPDTVALTSYYGKVFVKRSEKKVNDYGTWLRNGIMAINLAEDDAVVTDCHPGTVLDNLFQAPRLYSIMAGGFRSFTFRPRVMPAGYENMAFNMSFDHTKRESLYGLEAMKKYEQDGAIIAGVDKVGGDTYLLIGRRGGIGIAKNGVVVEAGTIETLLGIDRTRAPVDFAVMKVAGESIPVGVILAYVLGLDPLIALLEAKVRRVPAGRRLNLEPNEAALIFNDETLVIDKNDQLACMFLAGFNEYHRGMKRYKVHLFNKRDVYLNLLDTVGLGIRYLREIDLFMQMFVDPITRDLLIEMGEPTDVRQLLLRAGSMLLTDDHPDELDAAYQRLKGYERMAGAVYTELVRTLRKHNSKPGKNRATLDMSPYEIWSNIQTDPSKAQVMDINPIQNLKEKEAVTYNGVGGRNSRTMTKHTRAYHVNDMGTISGDTVDSSDVAINTYTSADPQFTSLRGISKRFDMEKMGATPLLSTSALISVGSDHDD